MLNVSWKIIDDRSSFVLLHIRRAKQCFCLLIDYPPIINDKCIVSLFNRSDGWIVVTDKIVDYDIGHVFAYDNVIYISSIVLVLRISSHIKLVVKKIDEPVIGCYLQLTIPIDPPVAFLIVAFGEGKSRRG